MADVDQNNLTLLTVDLLSAYLASNNVEHGDIAPLIQSTHAALKGIDAPEPPAAEEPEHKPAVSVRKSTGSRNHIISLIDGKPYQTLKRHLAKHGLTPASYRERYGLPKTYPMVAPAYSEQRRAIAGRLGLGRRVKGAQAPEAASAPSSAALAAPAKISPSNKVAVAAPAKAAAPTAAPKRTRAPKTSIVEPARAADAGVSEIVKATKPVSSRSGKTTAPRVKPGNPATTNGGNPTPSVQTNGKTKAAQAPKSAPRGPKKAAAPARPAGTRAGKAKSE